MTFHRPDSLTTGRVHRLLKSGYIERVDSITWQGSPGRRLSRFTAGDSWAELEPTVMSQPVFSPGVRADLLEMVIGRHQVNLLLHSRVLRRMVEGGEIEKTEDTRFRLPS